MAISRVGLTTRRRMLATFAGAVAGAATASLASAQRVLGAGSDGAGVVVGGQYLDARSETTLQNVATDATVLALVAAGSSPALDVVGNVGDAIHGFGTVAAGVKGTSGSNAGFGVVGVAPYVAIKGQSFATGTTGGSGVGVFGTSAAGDGAGVDGRGPNVGVHGVSVGVGVFGEGPSGGIGVNGASTGGGIGVLGNSDTGRAIVGVASASTGRNVGVMGESFSTAGTGVRGWASGGGSGVYGYAGAAFPTTNPPANTGVFGYGPSGRGGVFAGKAAQVRLIASTVSTHPSSGAAGDLFVDRYKRLWFCKGGTTWKQIA